MSNFIGEDYAKLKQVVKEQIERLQNGVDQGDGNPVILKELCRSVADSLLKTYLSMGEYEIEKQAEKKLLVEQHRINKEALEINRRQSDMQERTVQADAEVERMMKERKKRQCDAC